VKQGTSHFAARAIDIAPTMERLLGLPAYRRDGVVLADALLDATYDETKAQQAAAVTTNADAHALQQESAYDESGVHWPAIPAPPYRCRFKTPTPRTCTSSGKTATNS
jgi:hypothetical protein